MTTRFTLEPRGPFSLATQHRFLAGFGPGARSTVHGEGLTLAFRLDDGSGAAAAVRLVQRGDAVYGETLAGGALDAVRRQVARILSLDLDGRGFPEVARRDPVVGALQEAWPGFRPVLFHSPWEAAVWAVLTQRTPLERARRVWDGLTDALGDLVEVDGARLPVFPAPARLRDAPSLPGVVGPRPARLRALADAALDGRLDAEALRHGAVDEALDRLRELPGIGPFSAELVLVRAAGVADVLPMCEPRLRRTVAERYTPGEELDDAAFEGIARPWSPYRTWVSVLLRATAGRS